MACSCVRLLESLQLTCGVGQLVHEALRAHHSVYRSGCGCLLFLAGAWGRVASECLRRGISVPRVVSAMSEGMDLCAAWCRRHGVSVKALGVAPAENDTPGAPSPAEPLAGLAGSPALPGETAGRARGRLQKGRAKIKLTHSRHFSGAEPETPARSPLHEDIGPVARALGHGSVRAAALVTEAGYLQSNAALQESSSSAFNVGKMETFVLPGVPEDHACVLPGCVVRLSTENALVADHMKGRRLRVVLLTGGLRERYRHLGFKGLPGERRVGDNLGASRSSKEDEWIASVLTSLLRLKADLVLVSGTASEKLTPRCIARRILVVERVKASVLKAFADATGATPVAYVTQLSERCVGSGATVTPWRDLGDGGDGPPTPWAVNVSTAANVGLVTVVLASCVRGKLRALEDEFWACAYRVHHALRDGAVLPGAGATEAACVRELRGRAERHLKSFAESEGGDPCRDVVLGLMADALTDYVATVMANGGECSKAEAWTAINREVVTGGGGSAGVGGERPSGATEPGLGAAVCRDVASGAVAAERVYDTLSVKLEAWRRALDLVFLVLQTDAEVITGITPETLPSPTDFVLL